ncbi:MAG: hypothetical protein K0R98_1429 [Rickettsiaceae bacterium]|jgi:predicted secreted Zn-dependent protease|nr:hypothetical protein [Rickettsiaceae bacterium]
MKTKAKKIAYVLGLAFMASLTSFSAHAKPKVIVKHKEYKVRGKTMSQIQQSIRENGFVAPNGARFAANTNYTLNWEYRFNQTENSCAIASANVTVTVTYTMPKLEGEVPADTMQEWNDYYNALKLHEDGHANIGIETAQIIEDTIKTMAPTVTCGELTNLANQLANFMVQKANNDNIHYDEATNHGATQGAIFLASNY